MVSSTLWFVVELDGVLNVIAVCVLKFSVDSLRLFPFLVLVVSKHLVKGVVKVPNFSPVGLLWFSVNTFHRIDFKKLENWLIH